MLLREHLLAYPLPLSAALICTSRIKQHSVSTELNPRLLFLNTFAVEKRRQASRRHSQHSAVGTCWTSCARQVCRGESRAVAFHILRDKHQQTPSDATIKVGFVCDSYWEVASEELKERVADRFVVLCSIWATNKRWAERGRRKAREREEEKEIKRDGKRRRKRSSERKRVRDTECERDVTLTTRPVSVIGYSPTCIRKSRKVLEQNGD